MKVLYDRVSERLQEIGMSWGQLEELVEQKTGLFVGLDYIKGRLKKRKRIPRKLFHAVAEIIGEEIVYGKRKFD